MRRKTLNFYYKSTRNLLQVDNKTKKHYSIRNFVDNFNPEETKHRRQKVSDMRKYLTVSKQGIIASSTSLCYSRRAMIPQNPYFVKHFQMHFVGIYLRIYFINPFAFNLVTLNIQTLKKKSHVLESSFRTFHFSVRLVAKGCGQTFHTAASILERKCSFRFSLCTCILIP